MVQPAPSSLKPRLLTAISRARLTAKVDQLQTIISSIDLSPLQEEMPIESVHQLSYRLSANDATLSELIHDIELLFDEWKSALQTADPTDLAYDENIIESLITDKTSFLHTVEKAKIVLHDIHSTQKEAMYWISQYDGTSSSSPSEHQTTSAEQMAPSPQAATQYGPVQLAYQQPRISTSGITLPQMHLPRYNGDAGQWREFWEQFQLAVDQKPIDNVQKLVYLKTCLEGNAQAAIRGYPLTSENYPKLIQILKDKFGDEERIIDALTKQLYMVKPAATFKDSVGSKSAIE